MLPLRDRLPTRRPPIVNYLILALNVVVFIYERLVIEMGVHPQRLVMQWGLVPSAFVEDPLAGSVTVFSSMFMHDPTGWFHIGGNMLFLWIFGDNVEDALGSVRYGLFYLLSGIAAAMAQVLIDPSSHIPMVGASGAISGVLAAYGSLYPRSPITLLNPILPLWFVFGVFLELPAWVVILEYFAMNLFNGLSSLGARGGGVAFFAHLGGFVAGLLLVRVLMMGKSPRDHERWRGVRPPPRAPVNPRQPGPTRRGPWDW
jgi:membrane associated rhomboid family serine protease